MIATVRIDNRLIHGQVALIWTKHLGVNRILVANDVICQNEVQKATLKMACPSTAKCSILSVQDSIKTLLDPRAAALKILVIVNSPTDARRIVEAVPDVPYINVANYGTLGRDTSDRLKVADSCYLTAEDVSEFERIQKTGKRCEYQIVPDNRAKDMYKLIEKAGKVE